MKNRQVLVDVMMDAFSNLTEGYPEGAAVIRGMLVVEVGYPDDEEDRTLRTTQWQFWPPEDEDAGPYWLANVVREGTKPDGHRG